MQFLLLLPSKMTTWILTKDELPPVGKHVLIWTGYCKRCDDEPSQYLHIAVRQRVGDICMNSRTDIAWYADNYQYVPSDEEVVAWAEIPNPPAIDWPPPRQKTPAELANEKHFDDTLKKIYNVVAVEAKYLVSPKYSGK